MKTSQRVAVLFGVSIGIAASIALFTHRSGARNEFEAEGERLRERVVNLFRDRSRTAFRRFIDMTPFCKSESFEGMPLRQIRGILIGAGGGELIDVSTLSKQVKDANNADYFGGFDVGSSLFGNVNFSMSFRVQQRHGVVTVSEMTSCGVNSTYL